MLIQRKPERALAKVTKQINAASKTFHWEMSKGKSNSSWASLCEAYEKKAQKAFEAANIMEISRSETTKSNFNALVDRVVRECSAALHNVFYISEKIYTSTSLTENTQKFASAVKTIANYFGYEDFMTERLAPNADMLVSALNSSTGSISVRDAIKFPAETDDVKPLIDHGRPIPINHRLFNSNLSRIIVKYVKERNNYYI